MILHQTFRGPTKAPAPVAALPRRQRMTREQITARRYEDWRVAHDEGVPNEVGVVERRSIRLIAAIYGVSRQSVWEGIRRARTVRRLIRERIAAIDGELAAG